MKIGMPPKTYYAGLLDSLGRVQFNIQRNSDNTFSTRPSLRIKHRDDDYLIGLIGELLESKNVTFDMIDRKYGYSYFDINSRTDLEHIHEFLKGESTQLIRELAFIHGPYKEYFDSHACSAKRAYQLVKTIDKLHYSVRLAPKSPYPDLEELATEFSLNAAEIEGVEIPVGEFRENYPVEYIAGIVDGRSYFTLSIGKSLHGIGYNMVPQIILGRSAVHPAYASAVEVFCEEEDLRYNSGREIHTLRTIINGADSIDAFAPRVGPYLIAKHDTLAHFHQEFIPRFQAGENNTKQGFYELLIDFQRLNEQGPSRDRSKKYTPEFFEEEWADDIEVRDKPI
jgi:5-methylcytosine-specific restriction protein A